MNTKEQPFDMPIDEQLRRAIKAYTDCQQDNAAKDKEIAELKEQLGKEVTRGKLEALNHSKEERERFGRWCAQNIEWPDLKQQLSIANAQIVVMSEALNLDLAWHHGRSFEACSEESAIVNNSKNALTNLPAAAKELLEDKAMLDAILENKWGLHINFNNMWQVFNYPTNGGALVIGQNMNLRLAISEAMKK